MHEPEETTVQRRTQAGTRQRDCSEVRGRSARRYDGPPEAGAKPTGWDSDQRRPLQSCVMNDFK